MGHIYSSIEFHILGTPPIHYVLYKLVYHVQHNPPKKQLGKMLMEGLVQLKTDDYKCTYYKALCTVDKPSGFVEHCEDMFDGNLDAQHDRIRRHKCQHYSFAT